MRTIRSIGTLGFALAAFALAACEPRIDTRGNPPNPDLLAELKPGKSTRDDVADILGAPSTMSNFTDETWYYISERTETTAFLKPELKFRNVLVIRFDKKGIIEGIESRTAEDGQPVEMVKRTTPTAGNDFTLWDQLIGNVGRFGDGKKASGGK